LNGSELAPPPVDIVDESPVGDAAKALEQSGAGDLSGASADTLARGLEGDPAVSSSTPPVEEKRGRGRPPGAGKPFEKKPRPRGDATLTKKELETLRKAEVTALYEQAVRDKKALEEKLEDAQTAALIGSVKHNEQIDDALKDACGFAVETVANMAAAKYGPAARINSTQKEQLATAWNRVAVIYLGSYAEYSPVAAALLATVAVVAEKYVDVQLANSGSPRPALVAQG
jgi:hypothetical protein